jgi:hypothetical protein
MTDLAVADLQEFFNAELPKLAKKIWSAETLHKAARTLDCKVVGTDRGLVTSAIVGQSVFVSVGHRLPDSGQAELEYTRINDRTAEGLRALLAGHLQSLQHQIAFASEAAA